jgi:hypothetical protein
VPCSSMTALSQVPMQLTKMDGGCPGKTGRTTRFLSSSSPRVEITVQDGGSAFYVGSAILGN